MRIVAGTQAYLICDTELSPAYAEYVATPKESLDLASLVLGPHAIEGGEPDKRRELCRNVLGAVSELERRGVLVLVGVMRSPVPGIPDWAVAVITLTPRLSDPGAQKRRTVFVDKRLVQPGPG